MAVNVTNSTIAAFNTVAAVTSNPATAEVDGTAEVFTITPTETTARLLVLIGGTGAAADGDITYSFAAGDFWAGAAVTGTVTKNTEKIIQVETSKVLQDNGTIALTLTPASTDSLKTNHAAYVKVFELY